MPIFLCQISDIQVNGQSDDMTAKEKLLLWSQRMVEGNQGLRCDNFTNSWRDGRLFNAIIHKLRWDIHLQWLCLEHETDTVCRVNYFIEAINLGIYFQCNAAATVLRTNTQIYTDERTVSKPMILFKLFFKSLLCDLSKCSIWFLWIVFFLLRLIGSYFPTRHFKEDKLL